MTVRTTTNFSGRVRSADTRSRGIQWCAVIVLAAAAIGLTLAVLGVVELWQSIG